MYYEYPSAELCDLRNLLSLNRKFKKFEQGLRLRMRNHWWRSTSGRWINTVIGEPVRACRWCSGVWIRR